LNDGKIYDNKDLQFMPSGSSIVESGNQEIADKHYCKKKVKKII
jgi:hypothetical protein